MCLVSSSSYPHGLQTAGFVNCVFHWTISNQFDAKYHGCSDLFFKGNRTFWTLDFLRSIDKLSQCNPILFPNFLRLPSFFLQEVMIKFMISSEDQILLFQRFFQGNPLLMFYTVYRISCFLKDKFEAKKYTFSSVTLLVPEFCFWPANTRNNLILRRCLQILELLHKFFSDMIGEKW